MAAVEEALYRTLLRGRKNGEIKKGKDLRAFARFIYSSLQGLQLMAKATQDRKTLEDVVKVTLSALD
jgi:TetR/AcrR family transcriptional repressor of nem operon